MATFNSIDGQINSAGNNPPLNTDLICTLYRIDFPVTGGSIEYINHTGSIRKWSFSNTALSDRICKITSLMGVKLTDLGLVFNIAAETTAPTFKAVKINTALQVKSYKVYFGTATNPQGTISYNDELGSPKQLTMIGTTTIIKATKFNGLWNVRIVDLNPEIADIAPAPSVPFTILIGSYGTIVCPSSSSWVGFINPPVVQLLSGGINPDLNKIFAATSYALDFPVDSIGTIEYEDSNGKYKKYSLSKGQIMSPDGLLRDGITKIISISNVKLIDEGLIYKITNAVDSIIPKEMPIIPSVAKFYHVHFGNPVYPQGTITYINSKGASKLLTAFGKIITIDASKILSLRNVKIVEVGNV